MNEKKIVDTIKTIYYTFNKQFADIQMQMGICDTRRRHEGNSTFGRATAHPSVIPQGIHLQRGNDFGIGMV